MAWVRIVRFGQTVPVRSPSKPSLALFSVGESRLAAAIARPVAPLLGFALVAVLVMLTGAVPAHAKVTVTVSEEVVARGETAMIRAAVRPKAKFCTYWLKGRTRKMLSTKRVRNGQSTLRYVTKALVPGTYRVTVYCGKSGKGSARLKVGDTTLLPPRCPIQSFPRRQVRNRRYRRYHHPRPRRRPAVLRRAAVGIVRPIVWPRRGFACPTPRQERTRHGSR